MKNPLAYQFEICTHSVESCLAAQAGGAHRVELCASMPEGGTTPSWGSIALARELLHIKLHVIIRPRGGDFIYSPLEINTMLKDIEAARTSGVDGVVFGCLTPSGTVDLPAMKQLMEASKGLSVTFHRAFDVCSQPQQVLEQLIELGCDRVLTSGQAPTADQGTTLLSALQQQAAGRIILLAGRGVNEGNIAQIAAQTGLTEFHFSAREVVKTTMKYGSTEHSSDSPIRLFEYEREETTINRVRNTIAALQQRHSHM